MTSAIPPSSAGVPPSTRLNGWKEIAAYFGRGLRTVQRWEKAFGMPVHRIGSGRGENVHAFTAELNAWLVTASRSRDLGDQPDDSEPSDNGKPGGAEAGTPPVVPRPRSRRSVWIGLASILLIAVCATAFWQLRRPGAPSAGPLPKSLPQPSSAKADGDRLRVYDADGRFLWEHQFDSSLPSALPEDILGGGKNVLVDDIDGDGSREVLVFGPGPEPRWSTRLFCFDAAGRQLWVRTPDASVRFGEHDYPPPWGGYRMYVTGAGRGKSLWATWTHVKTGFFPCLLERLSGTNGQPLSEYWSAGYVNIVTSATVQGRASILVGANNNDHVAASLAVFDADNVNGAAPADTADKTCRNCPPGGPRAFLVFPLLELGAVGQGVPTVFDVRAAETGELSVWVAHNAGPGIGTASYQLDRNLRPVSAEIGAEYRSIHAALESAGRLKHAFSDRDRAELWPVLVHDGTRFVKVTGAITR